MLRITIELLPYGSEEKKTILGTGIIYNDGSGDKNNGNYIVSLYNKNSKRIWRCNRILRFKRKRYTAWDLLYKALKETIGERYLPKRDRKGVLSSLQQAERNELLPHEEKNKPMCWKGIQS